MYDSVITLLKANLDQDTDTGIFELESPTAYTETKAYAHVDSISRSEWFNAGNAGIKPDYRFRMPRSSYDGQTALDYGGVRYSIYRTYTAKNEIELYAQKATGATYGE